MKYSQTTFYLSMEEGTFTECAEGATKIIDQYVLAIGDGTE